MAKSIRIVCALSILALSLSGCYNSPIISSNNSSSVPLSQEEVTLVTGGYGYKVGDVVLIDTQKEPAVGDVVQYDWGLNKSNAMAMGPGAYLAKIIGLPGDNVSFQQWSYEANGFEVTIERYYQANGTTYEYRPHTKQVMWAIEKFDDVAGVTLKVPKGEFLADKWVGFEVTGEIVNGSSVTYNRFTIKKEAIAGVILKKLWHDQVFEDAQRNTIY